MTQTDRPEYLQRKRFFDSLITVYGRKPVLELLQDDSLSVYRLHLADSNQRNGIIKDIEALARGRGIDIHHHSRDALARISRNKSQDQGVAADVACPNYRQLDDFLGTKRPFQLLALDRVTNPQNLGMVIRSVGASPMDGLLLPGKGGAPLSPLAIKASAGTAFKCPILRCETLEAGLKSCLSDGADIAILAADGEQTLAEYEPKGSVVYVLGNETDGVSTTIGNLANRRLRIPMGNGVESLNVAITAALIAFRDVVARGR